MGEDLTPFELTSSSRRNVLHPESMWPLIPDDFTAWLHIGQVTILTAELGGLMSNNIVNCKLKRAEGRRKMGANTALEY